MRDRAVAVAALLAGLAVGGHHLRAQNATAPDWDRLNTETLQHFQSLVRLDTQNPPGNE